MNLQTIENLRLCDLPIGKNIKWTITQENNQMVIILSTTTEIPMRTIEDGIALKKKTVCIEMSCAGEIIDFQMVEPDPADVFLPNWSVSGQFVCQRIHRLMAQPEFQLLHLVDFLIGNLSLDSRYTFVSEAVNRNAAAWYLDNFAKPGEEDGHFSRISIADTDDVITMVHRNSVKAEAVEDSPMLTLVHRSRPIMRNEPNL